MKLLSENTSVSVGLLVIILGGAGFVTRVSFQEEANARSIQEVKEKQNAIEKIQSDLSDIKTDIAITKVKVENIEKRIINP